MSRLYYVCIAYVYIVPTGLYLREPNHRVKLKCRFSFRLKKLLSQSSVTMRMMESPLNLSSALSPHHPGTLWPTSQLPWRTRRMSQQRTSESTMICNRLSMHRSSKWIAFLHPPAHWTSAPWTPIAPWYSTQVCKRTPSSSGGSLLSPWRARLLTFSQSQSTAK